MPQRKYEQQCKCDALPCTVNSLSSQVCQLGTKGCVIKHPPTEQAVTREQFEKAVEDKISNQEIIDQWFKQEAAALKRIISEAQ